MHDTPPPGPPTAAPPPPAAPPRDRLPWRWVLLLSLGLNLLVLGLVAGAALSGRLGDGPPRGLDLATGPLVRALDGDDRRAIRRALIADPGLRPPSPGELRAGADRVVAALRADPFDPVAFAESLSAIRDRVLHLQDAAQAALVARVASMTPAQRSAYAERVARELGDGGWGGGLRPRDGGRP